MSADALAAIRAREYPDPPEGIFLNAASHGLLPRTAAEAAAELTLSRNRVLGVEEAPLGEVLRRCRRAVADLLAVDVGEITLAPNTSYGVNLGAALVAEGDPGTIVLSHGEFAANVYPWFALRKRDFTVDVVPTDQLGRPDEARLMERIRSDDVRALALSAVQFSTGDRSDLVAFGRACREQGVLFVVDAIQALGAVPLRPREMGVDVLASGGQKWLCAPWGSGFAWIHARHRDRFDPPMVSWLSMKASRDFRDMLDYRWDFLEDGRKYELATLGIQDYLALAHSVEMFLEMGLETVQAHLLRLHEPVLEWIDRRDDVVLVTPREPERRAGILAFRPPDIPRVARTLARSGVVTSVREGAVRLAPHFYNTRNQMEKVVGLLDEAVSL